MRRFSASIAFVLSTLLFVSTSAAQQTSNTTVPNLIRYGGTLKDAAGTPIATATGVTFAIYEQQDGGAPVWMETQNVAPDASGQYSVLLGSTTATGLPSDLFSQEEQRWLGVQVQGEAEQARVLLVSVPYAFKAHEAETLAGRSISDFLLAKDLSPSSSSGSVAGSGSGSTPATSGKGNNKPPSTLAASAGPTNFSGATTDQIVKVTQTGTGAGIIASSSSASTSSGVLGTISGPGVAIFGQAYSTSAHAYGVEGTSASTIGIGLVGFASATTGSNYGVKGYSSSTGGTGVRGLSTATTGSTVGISASVASPAGIAGVFNNAAGGKIISGQNNGLETFSVDGGGRLRVASLLASGIVDGKAPVTVTTGATSSLGSIYNSGYVYNQGATADTAITYTLPTAAAGKQYCVGNSSNGSVPDTGTLTLATSAPGQFIIYNGALSATGGYVISGGAAGDKACMVGVDSTHWEFYPQVGIWTLH
jgi:trimeric autotransporter adhesin